MHCKGHCKAETEEATAPREPASPPSQKTTAETQRVVLLLSLKQVRTPELLLLWCGRCELHLHMRKGR